MSRQEELESMSDLEINKLVNLIQNPGMVQSIISYIPKFCSSPADIMPIAMENNMVIDFETKGVTVFSNNKLLLNCYIGYSNKFGYCRAICIVFILMSESK
jgi:hypothetical protein